MVFCEQCGNQLNESAKFCGKCGAQVGVTNATEENMQTPSVCNQCGAPLEAGEAFCANCGAKVGATAGQYVQAAAACSQCGAPLEAGEAFCANCGAKVGTGVCTASNNIKENHIVEAWNLLISNRKNQHQKAPALHSVSGFFEDKEIYAIDYQPCICLFVSNEDDEDNDNPPIAIANELDIKRNPCIETKYKFNSGEKLIQVFIKSGILSKKIKICVKGEYIGGDNF